MFENIKSNLKTNSEIIDAYLIKYCDNCANYSKVLFEAQKYSLLGGKKIRAYLVMEICRMLSGDATNSIPYACAIEMIHASSLIHDDMPCMDNDLVRRGNPSTHVAFGETAALLAGDSLMAKAFWIISQNRRLSSEQNLRAIESLAFATGDNGMLAGQAIDTLSDKHLEKLDELLRLHNLKTVRLISASVELGCIAAGVGYSDARFISAISYAQKIGLAFQIIDDILDYKDGKIESNSFLSFMSLEEAEKYAKRLTEEAITEIEFFDNGNLKELALYLTVREY